MLGDLRYKSRDRGHAYAEPHRQLRPIRRARRALALAACGSGDGNNLAAIDNELLANGADPALTSALEDQILVDPNLIQQAHRNTARPAGGPVQAQYPADSDARMSRASGGNVPGRGRTERRLRRAVRLWPAMGEPAAGRLPALSGRPRDRGGRRRSRRLPLRVVTFVTRDPYDRVLEHYRSLAARAGFTAEHQVRGDDHVLGGVNDASDGAFYLIVTPVREGSEVALIVNNGR